MKSFNKVRQPKVSDAVEQQIEKLILEGSLRPGEKLLPERELAIAFDVSRPSLREAILRLEAKGLLYRKQGGGTFVQSNLWQSLSDPLTELLASHPESQFDLLETRHALEGISAYYAALRGTEEDLSLLKLKHNAIQEAQRSGNIDAEATAVLQYHICVTEAAHNIVLLHLLHALIPILETNIKNNFKLLYSKEETLPKLSQHRANVLNAILARDPSEAREASNRHLAFIEETILEVTKEQTRRERSLRRLQREDSKSAI
ncbi:pyruvate dehydrogenase complex transcriptional repressor PdhR [Thorsellia kenyensis]|uniref:Pyruvate dehydrogenase complex repressor n=1 Tax=Thorsellia kenyensis TaxID=1549888 RepID=A0ABV6C8U1_9GAMM